MADRLLLALDGSTGVCSAALLRLREHLEAGGETRGHFGETGDTAGDGGHQAGDGGRQAGAGDPWAVVARRSKADGRGQAKLLLCLVDEMLEEAGRRPRDLGVVVVGTGPGTFTGVRVTVATARALSLALALPVLGVSTLGALAAAAATAPGAGPAMAPTATITARLLVPVVDARRGQVFYGLYRTGEEVDPSRRRLWRRLDEFGVCDRDALGALVAAEAEEDREPSPWTDKDGGRVLLVGDETMRPGELPPGVVYASRDVAAEDLVIGQDRLYEPGPLPQGARLTGWLRRALAPDGSAPGAEGEVGAPGTPEAVTPIYVRSPDADVHITRMKDPWADGSGSR
jgi:tRNA threonylcarbamoyl adenosine modification protein YeaZ